MTGKRFFYSDMKERRSPPCIIDMKGMRYCNLQEVVKPLNKLSDENEKLIGENKKLKSTIVQLIEQKSENNKLLLSDIRILENALWCPNCANDVKRLKELQKEFLE